MRNATRANTSSEFLSARSKLLLAGLGLFFACLILEVGLRVQAAMEMRRASREMFGARTPWREMWPIYDHDLGYVLDPEAPYLNSDGLRDHPIGPKGHRFRVLFLADSIAVWGDSVDDTFVGHLRSALYQDFAIRGVEVINAGVTAYTNYQELIYLKKYGLKFQPDLVGVGFCLNDLHKFQHAFEVENGQLVPASYFSSEAMPRAVTRSWPRRLAKKSHLLVWLHNNLSLAAHPFKSEPPPGFSFEAELGFGKAWQDEPWKDIESQLGQMVELGRQNHFSVFLVVIPLAAQYNAQYLARGRDYVLKPQRKLKEICERWRIPFLDLYPELDRSAFLRDGIHLSKQGRQQAGRGIATFLVQSNLLPSDGSAAAAGKRSGGVVQ